MRGVLTLAILISCIGIRGYPNSYRPVQASRPERQVCDVNQLPREIQNQLRTHFAAWRVQTPENLSHPARLVWEGKKVSSCPGIAIGFFNYPKQSSYAILLVPSGHPDAAYKLVVFSPQVDNSSYKVSIVEESDGKGASNYFIQEMPVSKFFDEASKKKFQVHAGEAILMVDSAEDEYEADVYFWSNDRFRREPVDY